MEIIIYSQPDNPQKDTLLKNLSEFIKPVPIMAFDFEGLFCQLRSKVSGRAIIIFLISHEEELERLMADRSRLFNTKCIIVLPENGDDLAMKGLALQPRYLGYANSDFSDICRVLEKMINKHRRRQP